jgi:cell division protein FtsI (penicillin-binding protein 3)
MSNFFRNSKPKPKTANAGRPIRDEIQSRTRWALAAIFLLGSLITAQIIYTQQFERKKWLAKVEKVQRKERIIPATRGNIYAADGKSLMATSVPRYRVGIDPVMAKPKVFNEKIDSLCYFLADFFKDKSPQAYKEMIVDARKGKKLRFVTLGSRLIDFQEKEFIKQFPLFKEGKMKGGGKFETIDRRFMPFEGMALRTIGKLDRETQSKGDFGVEYSFNNFLAGKNGEGLFERLSGGTWKPIEDGPETRPEAGVDVVTTIDVNFQDIVESALHEKVIADNAKYGSAIVMEIKTGEIKAIANLSRLYDSTAAKTYFSEVFNYAVRGGTDPGSTFKLASMVALLEKANLNPNDFACVCEGGLVHNGLEFSCSEKHGNLTVKQVFEHSCNVGIYRLMQKHFGFNNPAEYVAYLRKFKLDKPCGFQLKGETEPIIKDKTSQSFSQTTIPWMSIGYETRLTPLQMLTFYNAIANNGNWVQPIIVKEIRDADKTLETYEANKDPTPICSEKTARIAKEMMIGVVENGTAKNINTGFCKVGGKTGTSQKRSETGYKAGKYYTAFIGFFPADNPKYSCAVVIDEPEGANLYARDVAAPVFREIADKIFAYDVALHPAKNKKTSEKILETQQRAGYAEDFRVVSTVLGIQNLPTSAGLVKAVPNGKSVTWQKIPDQKNNLLPDLNGMTLRDALYILENKGYRVRHSGFGKVADFGFVDGNIVGLTLR